MASVRARSERALPAFGAPAWLERLHQAQLAQRHAVKVRLPGRSVGVVARILVYAQRALVLLVGEEESLAAACCAQRVVGGGQEHAPNAPPGVSRIDEEEEQLSLLGMDRGLADHPSG